MLLISIYLITGPPLSPGQSNSYLTQFPFVKTEIVLIIQDVHGIQVILAHNVGLAYTFFSLSLTFSFVHLSAPLWFCSPRSCFEGECLKSKCSHLISLFCLL